MQEGGVDVQFFCSLYRAYLQARSILEASYAAFRRLFTELEANSDRMLMATTVDDIMKAKEQGKVAAVLAIEGGEALEGDLGVLRMFHRLRSFYWFDFGISATILPMAWAMLEAKEG